MEDIDKLILEYETHEHMRIYISKILASEYSKKDDMVNFIHWTDIAISLDKKNYKFLSFVADFFNNRDDEANEEKYLKIGSDNGCFNATIRLARIFYNGKLFEKAIQTYFIAISQFDPITDKKEFNEESYVFSAMCYSKLKNIPKFIEYTIHCYKIHGYYEDDCLTLIIEHCESISNYDILTDLVISEIDESKSNIGSLLDKTLDTVNNESVSKAICKAVERKDSNCDIYMNKYLFMISQFIYKNRDMYSKLIRENDKIRNVIFYLDTYNPGFCGVTFYK